MDALEVLVETYPQLLLYLYSYYVVSGYHTDNTDHDYTKIQEKFKTDETIAVGNGFFRLDPRFVFTIKIFIGVLLSSGCISTYRQGTVVLKKEEVLKRGNGGNSYYTWTKKRHSPTMLSIAAKIDKLAQLMFFGLRTSMVIWGICHDKTGSYFITSFFRTFIFFMIWEFETVARFVGNVQSGRNPFISSETSKSQKSHTPKAGVKTTLGTLEIPESMLQLTHEKQKMVDKYSYNDFTIDDPERDITSFISLFSYFTYNIGHTYLCTILNYCLMLIEVLLYYSELRDFLGFNPALLLLASFILASQVFAVYKHAIIFDAPRNWSENGRSAKKMKESGTNIMNRKSSKDDHVFLNTLV